MDNIGTYLRKLAKKTETLNIFTAAKDLNGIRLFENITNFSKLQNMFLSYLYFYKSIYEDIYLKKVSEKVITNELYEDAYTYYKSKQDENKLDKSTGKQRKLSATFSKNNIIKFPNQKEVN